MMVIFKILGLFGRLFPKTIRLLVIDILLDYFPGKHLHPNSLRTIVMLLSRPIISREKNIRFDQEMLTLVMSYTAVFCLTRGDKLSGIKDNELFRLREFANNLGVNIPGTDFLNGVIIKYSKGYKQISKAVFDDLLEKCKIDGLMDSEVTLRYLENRYRDHRPTSPRSGDLSEPAFNTVSTNNFAVRDNGSIYTFTQYSCHVLVFCGPDGMGLGHWKDFRQFTGSPMDCDVKRLLGRNYDQVYIISDTPEKIVPIFARSRLRIHTHRKAAGKRYAVKVHRDDCGVYSIQATIQGRKFKDFPLGPCNVTPVNQFKDLDFDGSI